MKNLTLIKHHPSVQLGHLYEHLFLRRVNNFLYQKKLYKYIDYYARGTTYEMGGVITVEIESCSKKMDNELTQLEDLLIDFGEDRQNITIELHRIAAEEQYKIYISDKQRVLDKLKKLDEVSWQTVDNFGIFDTLSARQRHAPIYLTNQRQAKRKIFLKFTLNPAFLAENRQLAPLFVAFSRFLTNTLADRLGYEFGTYCNNITGKPQPLSTVADLILTPSQAKKVDHDTFAQSAREVLHVLLEEHVLSRLSHEFGSLNYLEKYLEAPNIERMNNDSGVFIGSAGWREIATLENITKILTYTDLEIKIGRQKITLPLQQIR